MDRNTETDKQTGTQRQTDRDTEIDRKRQTETQRHAETARQTDRDTGTDKAPTVANTEASSRTDEECPSQDDRDGQTAVHRYTGLCQ